MGKRCIVEIETRFMVDVTCIYIFGTFIYVRKDVKSFEVLNLAEDERGLEQV